MKNLFGFLGSLDSADLLDDNDNLKTFITGIIPDIDNRIESYCKNMNENNSNRKTDVDKLADFALDICGKYIYEFKLNQKLGIKDIRQLLYDQNQNDQPVLSFYNFDTDENNDVYEFTLLNVCKSFSGHNVMKNLFSDENCNKISEKLREDLKVLMVLSFEYAKSKKVGSTRKSILNPVTYELTYKSNLVRDYINLQTKNGFSKVLPQFINEKIHSVYDIYLNTLYKNQKVNNDEEMIALFNTSNADSKDMYNHFGLNHFLFVILLELNNSMPFTAYIEDDKKSYTLIHDLLLRFFSSIIEKSVLRRKYKDNFAECLKKEGKPLPLPKIFELKSSQYEELYHKPIPLTKAEKKYIQKADPDFDVEWIKHLKEDYKDNNYDYRFIYNDLKIIQGLYKAEKDKDKVKLRYFLETLRNELNQRYINQKEAIKNHLLKQIDLNKDSFEESLTFNRGIICDSIYDEDFIVKFCKAQSANKNPYIWLQEYNFGKKLTKFNILSMYNHFTDLLNDDALSADKVMFNRFILERIFNMDFLETIFKNHRYIKDEELIVAFYKLRPVIFSLQLLPLFKTRKRIVEMLYESIGESFKTIFPSQAKELFLIILNHWIHVIRNNWLDITIPLSIIVFHYVADRTLSTNRYLSGFVSNSKNMIECGSFSKYRERDRSKVYKDLAKLCIDGWSTFKSETFEELYEAKTLTPTVFQDALKDYDELIKNESTSELSVDNLLVHV